MLSLLFKNKIRKVVKNKKIKKVIKKQVKTIQMNKKMAKKRTY
jgi:hypothetical protein